MEQKRKKAYYLFSPWLRMFHWIMVVSIFTLFATGLYIGDPGFGGWSAKEPVRQVGSFFSMEMIRRVHFCAGLIFVASFIFRIYGFLTNPGDRLLPRFYKKSFWTGAWSTVKHYLFIPQKKEGHYLRNSLARLTYFLIYFLILCEAITGLAMFSMIEPNSFLAKIFAPLYIAIGPFNMHMIHHYIAWGIMLFVIIHVYLGFRADVVEKNGEISSMISGRKYFEKDPEDIGDLK